MAMHILRAIKISSDTESPPRFLQISSADAVPQVKVSTQLRLAWTLKPSDDDTAHIHTIDPHTFQMRCVKDVGSFVHRGIHQRKAEEDAVLATTEDLSLHREWRDKLYEFWNHVFFDVATFLTTRLDTEAEGGLAHFHPPSSETFQLRVNGTGSEHGESSLHEWKHDALLVPAHLQPGIRVNLQSVGDEQFDDVSLDANTPSEIWYIRRDARVKLSVFTAPADTVIPSQVSREGEGVAAVMVMGIMCNEMHDPDDPPGRPEQKVPTEEETREADTQAEVQSSIANVLALAAAHRSARQQ